MIKRWRRALCAALCAILLGVPALGEGLRFRVEADLDPALYPKEMRQLLTGVAALLDVLSIEGTLTESEGSFDMDAQLRLGKGEDACVTELRVFGLGSHWGVRSTLLGDTELMVNNSALLPFGLKAREWLGLPLEKAALLAPYVHEDALRGAMEVLSPFFPAENGIYLFSQEELIRCAEAILTLADEDAAFNRWLEATGLYGTVRAYARLLISVSSYLTPGLTVTRTDNRLSWDVLFLNVLTLQRKDNTTSLSLNIPTLMSVNGTVRDDATFATGSVHVDVTDGLVAEMSFSIPTALPATLPTFYLTLDAEADFLPAEGLHLVFDGEAHGNTLLIRQLLPDHSYPLLRVTATLTPFEPEALPAYTPEDLTGMNILSVNGDSLAALMREVRWPLMTGVFDLLVAAPPEAVQTLMDVLEDAGVIDLLADAMAGGAGY